MGKIIGKYEFEDVTKEFVTDIMYGWWNIFPAFIIRHKYWYMWELELKFLQWSRRIQITRTDWDKHPERDVCLFWKRLKKVYKKGIQE